MNKKSGARAFFWFGGILLLLGGGYSALFGTKEKFSKPEQRTIELCEMLELMLPENFKILKIWVPVPKTDSTQQTTILKVESPFEGEMMEEKEFGNQLLYFEPKNLWKEKKVVIQIYYKITRKEQQGGVGNDSTTNLPLSEYLKERGLEIINEKIKTIAANITKHKKNPMEKAKAIYDYVLKHMQYDKSGTGWGRGDSVYACDIGKGNCTDFHSLFIALARASGIPARFQMGIPLSADPQGKLGGSYHCWAEFYVDEKGWVPVDISEAWKNRKKVDYFFGNLDVDRVLISTGREIELAPKQNGARLNYLSKAYIELDSKPFHHFEFQRTFKNLP